jgi:Fimbrial protein.
LRLVDCLQSLGNGRDLRTDQLTWAINQPAVTIGFNAIRDSDNPQLVKVKGTSGIGIRIEDIHGHDVRLGSRGKPLIIMPGQNTLTYTVMAERTSAPLKVGRYWAVVDLHLRYE